MVGPSPVGQMRSPPRLDAKLSAVMAVWPEVPHRVRAAPPVPRGSGRRHAAAPAAMGFRHPIHPAAANARRRPAEFRRPPKP